MKKTQGSWTTIAMPREYLTDVDQDLTYLRKYHNLPNEKTHINNTCNVPLTTLNIDHKGRVFLCDCDGWLPYSVGHITDFSNLEDVYNASMAKLIIKSVTEQKFTYCSTAACSIEKSSKFKPLSSLTIYLGIDISCNYSCPSCRERIIFDQSSEYLNERKQWADSVINIIKSNPEKRIIVVIGSNGETFVSKVYLHIIKELKNLSHVRFIINTNASSVIDHKDLLDDVFFKKVRQFMVSIDAATKETYEKLRRPGKWENLLENLDYITSFGLPINANFIVQKSNFREILPFVDFCKQYNMTISFTLMTDWGTYHNINEQLVHIPESPYYEEFRHIVSQLPESLAKQIS